MLEAAEANSVTLDNSFSSTFARRRSTLSGSGSNAQTSPCAPHRARQRNCEDPNMGTDIHCNSSKERSLHQRFDFCILERSLDKPQKPNVLAVAESYSATARSMGEERSIFRWDESRQHPPDQKPASGLDLRVAHVDSKWPCQGPEEPESPILGCHLDLHGSGVILHARHFAGRGLVLC
jgi:hypothetical protein